MDWTQFTPELFHSKEHHEVEDKERYHEAQRQIVNSAERMQAFRKLCEEELDLFQKMPAVSSLGFPHSHKIYRYIVHEAANARGFSSYSFGPESSRYTVVYKKGSEPSEELIKKWQADSEVPPSTTMDPSASRSKDTAAPAEKS